MPQAKIDDETKENLTDAELKAARSNPAGDTELSGAAPGAKGGDEVGPGPLKETAATKRAHKAAEDFREEVQDIQWDTQKQNLTNVPGTHVDTAYASRDGDKDPDSLSISSIGGEVLVVASTTKPMRFDRDNVHALTRAFANLGSSL